jgi:glycosyltransferase involved in cell wall biosynthesis
MNISVVIPTKNRSDILPSAIATVFAQRVPPTEVVVVNDGSTDATAAVLSALQVNEPRLRVLTHPASQGQAAARNAGARMATGALLAFNDDDCAWEAGHLDRLSHAIQNGGSGVGMAFSPVTVGDLDGHTTCYGPPSPEDPTFRRTVLDACAVGPVCLMFRRSVFLALGGFDATLPRLEDWDLWIRALEATSVAKVETPGVTTHMSADGISASPERLVRACALLSRKYAGSPWLTRGELARVERTMLRELLGAGATRAALPHGLRALRLAPFDACAYVGTAIRRYLAHQRARRPQ